MSKKSILRDSSCRIPTQSDEKKINLYSSNETKKFTKKIHTKRLELSKYTDPVGREKNQTVLIQ